MIKYMNNTNYIAPMKVIKMQGKRKIMNLDEEIKKLIEQVKTQAEYKMSDTFKYDGIYESVRNETDSLNCKAFGLSVEQLPDEKSRHYLVLNYLHPSMRKQTTVALATGSKTEILNCLKDEGFAKTFKTNLLEISSQIKNK